MFQRLQISANYHFAINQTLSFQRLWCSQKYANYYAPFVECTPLQQVDVWGDISRNFAVLDIKPVRRIISSDHLGGTARSFYAL